MYVFIIIRVQNKAKITLSNLFYDKKQLKNYQKRPKNSHLIVSSIKYESFIPLACLKHPYYCNRFPNKLEPINRANYEKC